MAVGIGKNVQKETLRQIAGGGSVVEVDDFNKLKGTIEEIKSKACSGEVTEKRKRLLSIRHQLFEIRNVFS